MDLTIILISFVSYIITVLSAWFLRGYIFHHLHINSYISVGIALIFPPLWWFLLFLAVCIDIYHRVVPPEYPYSPYGRPPYSPYSRPPPPPPPRPYPPPPVAPEPYPPPT